MPDVTTLLLLRGWLPAYRTFLMTLVRESVVPPAAYLPEGWEMECFLASLELLG